MFKNKIYQRTTVSLFVLLFLTFSLTTGLVLTGPSHVTAMPEQSTIVGDRPAQSKQTHHNSAHDYQAQQHTIESLASHTSNLCASLCQTNTVTTTLTAPLPTSESDKDDEIFSGEAPLRFYCQKATDEPEPVYKARKLKVPLYIKHCLLRL